MTNDMEHPIPISRASIPWLPILMNLWNIYFYAILYPVRQIQNHLNDKVTSARITGALMHYCVLVM